MRRPSCARNLQHYGNARHETRRNEPDARLLSSTMIDPG
jgi:hypothetical protein